MLLLALALTAAGLLLDLGGWTLGLNTLSRVVGSAGKLPVAIETGLNVARIGVFIGTSMLLIGFLLLATSLIVHFATKRKPPVIS